MIFDCLAIEAQSALKNLLETTLCGQLVRQQKVVQISADANVNEACQILIKNNISSAPVYDNFSNSYLGMLDCRDLVDYILIIVHAKCPDPSLAKEDSTQSIEWDMILAQALRGHPVKVRLTTDLSRKNPFYSVLPESNIISAVEVMRSGVHRVNVMELDSPVIGVLTQTDILKHIMTKIDLLRAMEKLTLGESGVVHSPVVTISDSANLLDALRKMSDHGISSIALVDTNGKLIGNVSLSDVKYLFKHQTMNYLWKTCLEFVSSHLWEEGLELGKDRYPFFDVTMNTSVSRTIGKLLATKTHRVWVVDDQGRPIGVVSMTDILQAICPPQD